MTCLGPPVLASHDRIMAYRRDGLWGQSSLPGVFYRHVEGHPDEPALCDAPGGPGTERHLTYAQADLEVRRLAARLDRFGLTPGDVIAMQVPPTIEAVLAILACLGLGFIVCPLPMAWRQLEIEQSLSHIGARAIVTWSDNEDHQHVEAARAAAFSVSSIRFVFGFGSDLPDGVTSLARALEEVSDETPPHGEFPLEVDANALALVTWDFAGGGPRALARSHNEWIAASNSVLFEAQLADGASILSPFALSGLAGIAGAFIPWLMTGGLLTLHRPFNIDGWRQQLTASEVDLALMPAALAPAFIGAERSAAARPRILGLVGDTSEFAALAGTPGRRVVALSGLGEIALLARRLDDGASYSAAGYIPIGPVHAGGAGGPVIFETRLTETDQPGRGEIEVSGAPVPSAILTREVASGFQTCSDANGFVAAGVCAMRDPDDETRGFSIGRPAGTIRHGATAISLDELDALYASLDAVSDAAAIAVEDRIMGRRIVAVIVPNPGKSITLDDLTAHLASKGAAGYKYPDRLIVLDHIPRTADGAIERDRVLAA